VIFIKKWLFYFDFKQLEGESEKARTFAKSAKRAAYYSALSALLIMGGNPRKKNSTLLVP
jgi:hypothetical protein